jgi:phosphopantothenoylcysteine decarboxylase/phosphopantothenate--cysteine ligase
MIVANNASTMGTDTNSIEIIRKDRSSTVINQKSKIELAYDILKEVILDLKKAKDEEK